MTELYERKTLEQRHLRIRRRRAVLCAVALLTLALCIVCACRANTANAEAMERAAVIISSAGGAAAILLYVFLIRDEQAIADHEQRILEKERERIAGTVRVGQTAMQIPRSIAVVSVTVDTGETQEHLQAEASRADGLRKAAESGARLLLERAESYVTGYEVQQDV